MNLRLKVNFNREEKQIAISMVCNHCPLDAAANIVDGVAHFSCPTHGQLGSASVEEVQAVLARAQNEAAQREGWGTPDFSAQVAHRTDEKPS